MVRLISMVGSGLIAAGGAVALAFGPAALPEYANELTVVGVLVLTVGLIIVGWRNFHFAAPSTKQKPISGAITMGDSYNNTGNNFGHMGPVYHNHTPPQRKLGAENKAELRAMDRNRLVAVYAAHGDHEALSLAQEIYDFMKTEGFTMTTSVAWVLDSNPVKGVRVITDGGKIAISVGTTDLI